MFDIERILRRSLTHQEQLPIMILWKLAIEMLQRLYEVSDHLQPLQLKLPTSYYLLVVGTRSVRLCGSVTIREARLYS